MIYMTQFDPATKQCTSDSVDSGMRTLDEVLQLMGEPVRAAKRIHVYQGVAFSDFVLRAEIDTAANSGHHTRHLPTD